MAMMRLCIAPGCDEIAVPGSNRCDVHAVEAKARVDAAKARAKLSRPAQIGAALYATPAWRKARKSWLARYPLCADCGELGLVVAAREVDHIRPHRGDKALFWDRGNWQSLCKPCHSRKTAREVFHGGAAAPGGVSENPPADMKTGGKTFLNVRGKLGKKATWLWCSVRMRKAENEGTQAEFAAERHTDEGRSEDHEAGAGCAGVLAGRSAEGLGRAGR